MHAAFQHLKSCWLEDPYPAVKVRKAWLSALERMLVEQDSRIAELIAEDFGGRDPDHTRLVDILPSLLAIRHARRHLHRWMQPERRPVSWLFWPARAQVVPQPLGVVGIVVPWNYPVYLSVGPLVAALAAGNRVMLKPSEHTPAFSGWLSETLPDYLPRDVVQVVLGDAGVAEAFTRLPFDHLLFTGSTDVGRKVMAAAAENLTPVTLELGGKSPVVVDASADLERTAKRILQAKWTNAGQTCVAPDYVLTVGLSASALAEALRKAAATLNSDEAITEYTSLISTAAAQRMQTWVSEAEASGATIIPLLGSSGDPCRLGPTVVLNPRPDVSLMQEEIFGPLLPILEMPDQAAAMRWIQQRPRPLALYLFTRDQAFTARVLAEVPAGGVTLNDCMLHVVQETLPFGGVGESGMGHYHGREGFVTFSKMKPVLQQSRWAGTDLLSPPYRPWKRHLVRWLIRWAR